MIEILPVRFPFMRARSFCLVVLLLASTTIHLMLTEELTHLIEEPTVHRTSSPTDPVVEFYQATDPVRQLETSTSGRYTCYVTKAGSLHCWGDNDNSNLGDGTTTDRREPVIPSGMQSNVSMVALGLSHACADGQWDGSLLGSQCLWAVGCGRPNKSIDPYTDIEPRSEPYRGGDQCR